jgi:hypothetical protein
MSQHACTASMCTDCDVLLRKPYSNAAHESLKNGASKSRPQGKVEMFACMKCGTHWERFRRKTRSAAAASVWRTL